MSALSAVSKWALDFEGSTRSSALIRISLAAVVWSRWANELILFRNLRSEHGLEYVLLGSAFYLFSTLMFVGLWSRVSTLATGVIALTIYWYFGHDLGREPWTHHHTYILAFGIFLCGLTPCGGSFSVDRWWAVRKARARGEAPPPEWGNLWGLRLIGIQLSSIYLWTAINKTNVGFLSGDRMEHYMMWFYTGSDYPQIPGFHAVMLLLGVGTTVLEYALAIGLWFPKPRRVLVPMGLMLHAGFYVLLPVSTYTTTMWALYLAFFDPAAVHRTVDALLGTQVSEPPSEPAAAGSADP